MSPNGSTAECMDRQSCGNFKIPKTDEMMRGNTGYFVVNHWHPSTRIVLNSTGKSKEHYVPAKRPSGFTRGLSRNPELCRQGRTRRRSRNPWIQSSSTAILPRHAMLHLLKWWFCGFLRAAEWCRIQYSPNNTSIFSVKWINWLEVFFLEHTRAQSRIGAIYPYEYVGYEQL